MRLFLGTLLAISLFPAFSIAEEPKPVFADSPSMAEASPQSLAAAVGHYERSRSLLLAAVREFDKGYNKANPSHVLDAHGWREDVINRIKELDKVLAPQARITEGGVRFSAERDLLASEAGSRK